MAAIKKEVQSSQTSKAENGWLSHYYVKRDYRSNKPTAARKVKENVARNCNDEE